MLLDERIDALTAMGTSMALVWNNLPVMLTWGAIVLVLFVVSLATGLLGLIVVSRCWATEPGMPTAPSVLGLHARRRTAAGEPRVLRRACGRPSSACPASIAAAASRGSSASLGGLPGVERARVNLSTRRVTVAWRGEAPPPFVAALGDAGYDAHLHDADADGEGRHPGRLVRALAVAGFAAGNIMCSRSPSGRAPMPRRATSSTGCRR